jgi:alpha-glucosidase
MDPFQSLIPAHTTDLPEVHDIVRRMRDLFDRYDDRVLIGEIYLPVERLVSYYGPDLKGAHLPFNFQLILSKWDARHIATLVSEYEAALPAGAWPNWVLGNHDQHRIATRVGTPQARVAAMLLFTLRGTPTLYYGDEIGMRDVPIPPQKVQDPFERNVPGKGLGRDPERTPMQWTSEANAGFSVGEPWLPIAEDYALVNVERQKRDAGSMLALCRRLIALRRGEPALEVGRFEAVEAEGNVLAYVRRGRGGESAFLVALNLGAAPQALKLRGANARGVIALSTHLSREGERVTDDLLLRPDEGLVVRLTDSIEAPRARPS